MTSKIHAAAFLAALLAPASASAGETGFFLGPDLSGGLAFGSSSTTNGGSAWAGGGIVSNVGFGTTVGIGGHAGYRFGPALSAFVSYEHAWGDVSWNATFPMMGVASLFKGAAISDVVMGNIAYDLVLSDRTTLRAGFGAGLSFNSLAGVVETDVASGGLVARLADHTRTSPAVRIGAGIEHRVGARTVLGLNTAVSYVGGFETGNTRSAGGAAMPIGPYRIDDVWRASLGASMRFEF